VISTFHQFVTSIYICDASVLAVFMQKKREIQRNVTGLDVKLKRNKMSK
jgi:hypothetical protein